MEECYLYTTELQKRDPPNAIHFGFPKTFHLQNRPKKKKKIAS